MEAEAILRFALYKEVLKRKQRKNKKRKLNTGGAIGGRGEDDEDEGEESESDDEEEEAPPARMEAPKAQPKALGAPDSQNADADADADMDMDDGAGAPAAQADENGVRPERCVLTFRFVSVWGTHKIHSPCGVRPTITDSHCSAVSWLNCMRPRCWTRSSGSWPISWRLSTRVSPSTRSSAPRRRRQFAKR